MFISLMHLYILCLSHFNYSRALYVAPISLIEDLLIPCWSQAWISVHSKIHTSIINWVATRHLSPLLTRYLIVSDPSRGQETIPYTANTIQACLWPSSVNRYMYDFSEPQYGQHFTTRFCRTPQY